jgi:hypothetical protein
MNRSTAICPLVVELVERSQLAHAVFDSTREETTAGRSGCDTRADAIAIGAEGGRSVAARLPSWFYANRVQGHTRLILGEYVPRRPRYWYGTPEFDFAARGFGQLGAGAFTRHVKSADEDPWWPTELPLDDDGLPHSSRPRDVNGVTLQPGKNVAKEVIEEAHAEGLKMIAYYWDASEATLAAANPDWVCKEPDKTVINSPRGPALDLTGPYREVVLARLLELAEMGADGFFFDNLHLPRAGCWHTALEAAWVAETGDPVAPPPPKRREDPSPRYLEFLDFRALKIVETFTYWRDAVKAQYPNVVFVISVDDFASLMNRGVTTRLVAVADSAKNEFWQVFHPGVDHRVFAKNAGVLVPPPGHVRQSLSWTALRDSSRGRPPHIWHPGVPSAEQAVALAGSLLTFGAIANMDAYEGSLITQKDRRGKTPVDGLKKAFSLGKVVSPRLAGTTPLRWAAVHFSERIRNGRGFDYLAMWQQVLWPLVGPYQVLTEDGLPVGIVNDGQLNFAGLVGYRLLVLPNPHELNAIELSAMVAFKARGGAVIANDPAWAWSDPAGADAAAAAFRAALQPHLASAPLQVTGGPPGRYAVSYTKRGPRLVVAATNDFGWVQFSTINKPIPKSEVNPAPPPASGVQVRWRKGQGLPEAVGRKPRLFPPQAIEVVSGATLPVHSDRNGYWVDLPDFQHMALLAVAELGPSRRPPKGAPGRVRQSAG